MPTNLMVTCEKQLELDDLIKIAIDLKRLDPLLIIHFIDISELTGEKLIWPKGLFSQVLKVSNKFDRPYYKLGLVKKIVAVIYGSKKIYSYIKKNQVTDVLYGVSIIFFRIINFLPRKYRTFSYIRSIVCDDNLSRKKLPKFIRKLLNSINITKPYIADAIFCIDKVTTRYINNFYLNDKEKNIFEVGSIYAYDLFLKNNEKQSFYQKITNVCFLTSAFSWHGDVEASKNQILLLKTLYENIQCYNRNSSDSVRFFVKIHPRDPIDLYETLLQDKDISIIENLSDYQFNRATCFVSTLSTLSLELKIAGFKSVYLANDFFIRMYADWYHKNAEIPLNVSDINLVKSLLERSESKSIRSNEVDLPPQQLISKFIIGK